MCSWEMLYFAYIAGFQNKWYQLASTASDKEKYQILVKNWIFDDPIHKKGLVLFIWLLEMIKPSGSVNVVDIIEAIETVEIIEIIVAAEVLRSKKYLLRTSESSSIGIWIQLYFYALKKKIGGRIIKYRIGF